MSEFVDALLSLKLIDKSLDYLFDIIDDLLIAKKFDIVDDNILEFIKECKSFDLYIGFLTITFRYSDKLKNIEKLQMKSVDVGQTIMSFEDTLSTMHGLLNDNVIKMKSRKEKLNKLKQK